MQKTYKVTAGMFILSVALCIISVIVIISSKINTKFPLALIPTVYAIGIVGIAGVPRYIKSPGFLICNVLYAMRFYCLPILIMLDSRLDYVDNFEAGIWLMLFEEIVIVFTLVITDAKRRKILEEAETEAIDIDAKALYKATIALCIMAVVIYLIHPSIINKYNFIIGINGDLLDQANLAETSGSTLGGFIVRIAILLVPASVCMYFADKYNKKKRGIFYFCSFAIPTLLSMAIIEGSDRGTVLLQGIAIVYMAMFLMPDKADLTRRIAVILLSVLGAFFVLIRIFQNAYYNIDNVNLSRLVDYIEAYVAGFKNMSVLPRMKEIYSNQVGIGTFVNDVTANVPVLSHIANPLNTCGKYFNLVLGRLGTDQVMPLLGNGLMYFGYLLSPVFNIIMINVVIQLDLNYKKANNGFAVYASTYAAAMIAFCHYQNLQLIMLYFTCRVLPLWLVYIFIRKIRIRRL